MLKQDVLEWALAVQRLHFGKLLSGRGQVIFHCPDQAQPNGVHLSIEATLREALSSIGLVLAFVAKTGKSTRLA
jgi:hypothetical protein